MSLKEHRKVEYIHEIEIERVMEEKITRMQTTKCKYFLVKWKDMMRMKITKNLKWSVRKFISRI